ncbi:MAG: signal peptidase I [Alphaproteobacteria bacterium]|nr:signal peptidase I [Alphaproteobacteria bacterium]
MSESLAARRAAAAKKGEGFIETIKTVVSAVGIALVIRTFMFEPFNIPSGSMIPTLLVGDYLFVSKYSYGYSKHSFPLSLAPFSGRFFMSEPERGDVAVFKYPRDNKTDYIKRIVGLPGDTVKVTDGRLFLNGQLVPRDRVDDYVATDAYGSVLRQLHYKETLPDGHVHYILEEGDARMFDNTREFTVPPGHYFMMGDNRDHSADSRADVGFVPAENLVGRAEFIFYSHDGSAAIWEVWRWPFAIRFSRMFTGIN